jgi:hypothetical protein
MKNKFYATLVRCRYGLFFLLLLYCLHVQAQQANVTQAKPYIEQWVYRVKYGFKDEWWKLFQKNQLTVLNKEKELGYIINYTIYEPAFHMSEESRWDFQLIIVFKDRESSTHASEIEKQLFPDRDLFKKEENRRWELTTNHWDMPLVPVDPGRSY